MGIKQKREIVMLADEVEMTLDIEVVDGVNLDTEVNINGPFFVCGERRESFTKQIQKLVDEYRI